MTKVKVMRFRVSNWTTVAFDDDKTKANYIEAAREVMSEAEVTARVNAFIKDKQVVNIITNTVDVHYHNNGRSNTVDLIYTIVYNA
jgi:hypothetical protein